MKLGRLRPTAMLACPDGVDREFWERAVASAWADDPDVPLLVAYLENGALGSVQEEWDRFQHVLTQVLLRACFNLSQNGLLDIGTRDACFRAATQRPYKGRIGQHVSLSSAQAGVRHDVGNLAVRKMRRWLARCYEYKRLLCRSFEHTLSSAQEAELCGLRHRLQARFGQQLGLPDVLGHIASLREQLAGYEQNMSSRRLGDWRDRLVRSDAALSRWLNSKINPVGVAVADLQGGVAETDVDAARVIFDYWRDFWEQKSADQPSLQSRVNRMCDSIEERHDPGDWRAPTGQELRALACDGKGACGPDGWTGCEIAWLPLVVFDVFALLAKRWLACGVVPDQMCESRMVCLPKPGKLRHGNVVSVQDTRPITVLSTWWRLWSSAWTRGVVRGWMRSHIPRDFAVAHAVSTGEVVVDLLDHLSEHGYMMSLDFSKAFDCLDPLVTREVLLRLGWDPRVVAVLTAVWSRQKRWVIYQSHTHPVTLSGPSMPQGDPMGPVIMTIWAWLGWLWVERHSRPDPNIMTRVYVDDRSFGTSRIWSLHDRFHQWSSWSWSVGLQENQVKAVAVASTPARRATLRRVLPDAVRNDVEILGSCSMVTRRGLLGKEAGRVDACKRTLTLLSCVRLPFERYMRACRQFAVSKVAYGWIARAPPLTLCTHLWSQVHVGSRRLRLASVWLRAALFGGGMHLDILFATQLVGILARLRRHRTLTWCTRGGSPACALNAWLRSRGWSFDAEWKWTHADSGHTLNLNDDGHHGEDGYWQHMVRDAWRAWCLRRHMSSSRRDSALDCFHAGYFKRIDWAATRAWAASCAEARSVCVGALFSPAARGGRGPGELTTSCIWNGCGELGTFEHICWCCPYRPPDLDIPPKPNEGLSSRYGWVITNQRADIVAVQDWLVYVQRLLWEHAHPSA